MKWEKKTLGEIVNLKRGYDLPSQHRKQGIVPIISSSGITDYHSEPAKTGEGVVTGRNGTLGQLFYINGDYWPLNTTLYVQDFKGNTPRFIYYFLKTLGIEKFNAASAVPGLDRNVLHKIDVEFISHLPTQRKIASILSAYDDLIENNLKRIKLLEEKAFLRYKGIVKSEKMEEYFIADVCETLGGGTPSTGNLEFWNEGEILWFSPTDLTKHNSIVLLDSEKKITELGLQKSSAKLLPPKTILMTSRASIGYFGLINKAVSTNQGFINIIPFKEYHRAYLLFDLKNRKEEIIGNANGSTFLEISKGKFRQMKVKLPKNETVLFEFEKEFELLFNLIENLLKQNAKLREARDILLPRLMSGEVEV